jgi:hypothetical protein
MDPAKIAPITSIIANLAAIGGIPIALAVYVRDRRKENHVREQEGHAREKEIRARELETYLNVSRLYEDYIRHCLDHPALMTPETRDEVDPDKRKLALHLCIALNMLECAYFLYYVDGKSFLQSQWGPWKEYMKLWCVRPELIEHRDLVQSFDSDFVKYMEELRAECLAVDKSKSAIP